MQHPHIQITRNTTFAYSLVFKLPSCILFILCCLCRFTSVVVNPFFAPIHVASAPVRPIVTDISNISTLPPERQVHRNRAAATAEFKIKVGKCKKTSWTNEEDAILRTAVEEYGRRHWIAISGRLPGRTDLQCHHRWSKVLDPDINKGPWTREEDTQLAEMVKLHSTKGWARVASGVPNRTAKQCRERWVNQVDPSINHGDWTQEELDIIHQEYAARGGRWAEMSKLLPGRYVPLDSCSCMESGCELILFV